MLKPKSTTISTNGNGNAQRMPKASDFKLPKRLSAAAKRRIETTQVILEAFRKVREGETTPEK
jgi:hypothetical protein